jgi:hypothetical protein
MKHKEEFPHIAAYTNEQLAKLRNFAIGFTLSLPAVIGFLLSL